MPKGRTSRTPANPILAMQTSIQRSQAVLSKGYHQLSAVLSDPDKAKAALEEFKASTAPKGAAPASKPKAAVQELPPQTQKALGLLKKYPGVAPMANHFIGQMILAAEKNGALASYQAIPEPSKRGKKPKDKQPMAAAQAAIK